MKMWYTFSMRNNKAIKIFDENHQYFACPLCGASFHAVENASLICIKNNHCFDIATKGYVNFIPNQKQESEQYSKKLFESRAYVFDAGVYDKVINEIQDIISLHFAINFNFGTRAKNIKSKRLPAIGIDEKNTSYNTLDVGCGEGYYAAKLSENPELNVFAIDIIKDAILASCKKKAPVKWMVADLTKIPMQNESVDVLLNVLTTANYEEFKRVLKKDGIIIKVIPGSDYLKEIRELVKPELRNKEYSNENVVELFEKHVSEFERKILHYEFPVDANLFKHLVRMTPMTAGIDIESLELDKNFKSTHITIDLKILAGLNN